MFAHVRGQGRYYYAKQTLSRLPVHSNDFVFSAQFFKWEGKLTSYIAQENDGPQCPFGRIRKSFCILLLTLSLVLRTLLH